MKIGIPLEIKTLEGRVALVPEAAADLVKAGHRVFLQHNAGLASGFTDEDYRAFGIGILPDAESLYGESELVVKVKEPVGPELERLREDHLLFSFLHLAAEPALTRRLCEIGLTAVAFETVVDQGGLPILAPMSEIAGRIAVQVGTNLLYRPNGGKGRLLGGLTGVQRGKVVILGGGNAGGAALRMANAMGADISVFDKNIKRLDYWHHLSPNISTLYPFHEALGKALREADLVIGSILVAGAAAPKIISREQVASMEPGSVIIDIAVDQGGCVETTRPTTYAEPTYVEEGVTHFGVTNMPGAVPRTASEALSTATLPYLIRLAQRDWQDDPVLGGAVNVAGGKVVHPALL